MKTVLKVLKYIGLAILGLALILGLGTAIFMNTSPQFGGEVSESDQQEYEKLDHYSEGYFENLIPTSMEISFSQGIDILKQQMNGVENGEPDFKIPVIHPEVQQILDADSVTQLVWFGHSAFLLYIDGKSLLLDPMLGETPSPVSFMGPKRYSSDLPIAIEDIPHIDAILISHDHYDHLDYESIMELNAKTDHFFLPLGVGAHFEAWGIEKERIHELDWWQEENFMGLQLAFAPSRHFSGRGFARNETLWGSWIIKGEKDNVYFSGDGGYGPHFKEIGEKYGPFDLALLECGQYNELWGQIHMMPEETAQSAIDVKAKKMMPIHWGMFQLALHSWTDPIERVTAKAEELNVSLIAPRVGEVINLHTDGYNQWWKKELAQNKQ